MSKTSVNNLLLHVNTEEHNEKNDMPKPDTEE